MSNKVKLHGRWGADPLELVERYSFFVDRDIAAARRYLDAATSAARSQRDEHRALIGEALDFVVSDEFKEF